MPRETHVGAAVAAGDGNGTLGAGLSLAAAVVGRNDVCHTKSDGENDFDDAELHLQQLVWSVGMRECLFWWSLATGLVCLLALG